MHILAAIAEFERARIAERVRAGLARARANGRRLGQHPRWTPQNRPFRAWRLRLVEFYLVASVVRKSDWIFVRQLRGPHLRTWP